MYHRMTTLLTLLVVVLAHMLQQCQGSRCEFWMTAANREYYSQKSREYITPEDQLLESHGGRLDEKCKIMRDYLEQNKALDCLQGCDGVIDNGDDNANTGQGCDVNGKYRSYDGTCNNLNKPDQGKTGSLQKRVLPNSYDDGKSSSRTRGVGSDDLPSTRLVSNAIHRANQDLLTETKLSYMFMQFGQILAHDFILTKTVVDDDGTGLACCGEDADHAECDPIQVPDDDPNFLPNGCLTFSRSKFRLDDEGVRQQTNDESSYLDLSMIYGPTKAVADSLRTFSDGMLATVGDKLVPDVTDATCDLDQPFHARNFYCTMSGDPRSDEQPGLASLHSVLHNYHNVLARELAEVNAHWDDERLYQEARKTNIGIWQNIVYSEYLPHVVGWQTFYDMGLNVQRSGFHDSYDESVDATVMNNFGIAFRYGHSNIHNIIGLADGEQDTVFQRHNLSDNFFRPNLYHERDGQGYKDVLQWTISTECPFTDRVFEDSVQSQLFMNRAVGSLDLISINNHRSRDHGLPGYNAFRALCGLSVATHFNTWYGGLINHDSHVAAKLEQVYSHPGDIDLLTGILTETRTRGSTLGPLGQCLIGRQFLNTKHGDRFYFERDDPTIGFTLDQLNGIREMKLSRLICDTTNINPIQRYVFIRPIDVWNPKRACSGLPNLDFTLWKER